MYVQWYKNTLHLSKNLLAFFLFCLNISTYKELLATAIYVEKDQY